MKRSVILAGLAALFVTAWLCTSPHAMARTPFDGAWSVLIVTDRGTCDRAYRYALRIADGRVTYDDPSFSVSGVVESSGRGEGSWSGRSTTSQCSGHWQAERRG